ncbi:MAG TPA: hypothetical protein VGM12_08085, partial [Trebonia sp.]
MTERETALDTGDMPERETVLDRAAGDGAAGDRAAGDRAAGDRAAGDRAAGDGAAGDRAGADRAALDRAAEHAHRWLDSLASRPVPPQASVAEVVKELGTELPDGPTPAAEVIDLLAGACEPGLTAMPSGRFYGMVIGGAHPAALAADWLV